jgi:hypothetical protein
LFGGGSRTYGYREPHRTAKKMGVHSIYDQVINKAVRDFSHQPSVSIPQGSQPSTLIGARSLSSLEQLPYLIPQKTNVLTGAATSYYRQQPAVWNTEYLKLVNYQKRKDQEETEQTYRKGKSPNHACSLRS